VEPVPRYIFFVWVEMFFARADYGESLVGQNGDLVSVMEVVGFSVSSTDG
jgi:hypothetical protein